MWATRVCPRLSPGPGYSRNLETAQHLASKDARPTWLPRPLRRPALIGMIIVTLTIVALLEVAARKLPAAGSQSTDPAASRSQPTSSLRQRRQVEVGSSVAFTSTLVYTPVYRSTSPAGGSSAVAISDYAQDITTVYTPILSDISQSTQTSSSEPVTSFAATSLYAQDSRTIYSPAPPSAPPSVYAQDATTVLYTRLHSAYGGDETGLCTPFPSSATMSHEAYASDIATIYTPLAKTTQYTSIHQQTSDATAVSTLLQITASAYAYDTITLYTASLPAETSSVRRKYSTLTTTYVALRNADNPNYNQKLMPASSITDDAITIYSIVVKYPAWASVLSSLVPVAVITLYRGFWSLFYASIKLIEPFILLSGPSGAPAKRVLHSYYTSTAALNPLIAVQNGHWLMIWASVVYLASGMFAPLASETLMTNTHSCPEATNAGPGEPNPCLGQLMVDLRAVRALQGLLAFAGIMVRLSSVKRYDASLHFSKLISLALMLRRLKTTGVHNDPSSIAGIASLVHHPDVLFHFKSVDGEAGDKAMKLHLSGKRYRLGSYYDEQGAYRYGFLPVTSTSRIDWRPLPQDPQSIEQFRNTLTADRRALRPGNVRTNKQNTAMDIGLWLITLGLFAVIIAYYFESSGNGFNRFFNSESFGPRFVLTFVGGIITATWKIIYFDVSLKSVYAALAADPLAGVDARQSICKTQATLPLTGLVQALISRHYFEAFIGFVAVIGELLIIALPGIPFTSGERLWQFYICSYMSLSILGIMILAVPVLLIWRLKMVPHLPIPLPASSAMSLLLGVMARY